MAQNWKQMIWYGLRTWLELLLSSSIRVLLPNSPRMRWGMAFNTPSRLQSNWWTRPILIGRRRGSSRQPSTRLLIMADGETFTQHSKRRILEMGSMLFLFLPLSIWIGLISLQSCAIGYRTLSSSTPEPSSLSPLSPSLSYSFSLLRSLHYLEGQYSDVGTHTTWLAQLAPALAAVACLTTAYVIVWMIFFRQRQTWFLFLVASYMFWCIFFSLLYITAGPNPAIEREHAVVPIRNAEISGAITLLIWAAMMVRSFMRSVWLPPVGDSL